MHSFPAAERSDHAKLRARKGRRVSDVQSDEQLNPQQNIDQPPGDSRTKRNIGTSCVSSGPSAESQRKDSFSLFHHPLKKKVKWRKVYLASYE